MLIQITLTRIYFAMIMARIKNLKYAVRGCKAVLSKKTIITYSLIGLKAVGKKS